MPRIHSPRLLSVVVAAAALAAGAAAGPASAASAPHVPPSAKKCVKHPKRCGRRDRALDPGEALLAQAQQADTIVKPAEAFWSGGWKIKRQEIDWVSWGVVTASINQVDYLYWYAANAQWHFYYRTTCTDAGCAGTLYRGY